MRPFTWFSGIAFLLLLASRTAHGAPASLLNRFSEILSAPTENDQVTVIVPRIQYRTLEQMARASLESASLGENAPWSDDYWPFYSGLIARRYADVDFPNSNEWKVNYRYAMSVLNSSSVDALSPAEKYDLLTGDEQNSLTRAMWKEGEGYFRTYGKVESWMGICEGWAAASIVVPRPSHSVSVMAADGKTWIKFYPSDIKALASLLWSRASAQSYLTGQRCNEKDPSVGKNGRVEDGSCLDTNPATLHLAVVNQLGAGGKSLVMDATYSYEVWNQPIHSYRYTLFDVKTREPSSDVSQAKVAVSDYADDPYAENRSPHAKYIVGVTLELSYVAETSPSPRETDSPEDDAVVTAEYEYDLELNAAGEIVGGEWHQKDHPDFLWTPAPGARARSVGDTYLERKKDRSGWDGNSSMPDSWRHAAANAARVSQPLERIVMTLVALSRM